MVSFIDRFVIKDVNLINKVVYLFVMFNSEGCCYLLNTRRSLNEQYFQSNLESCNPNLDCCR